MTSCRRSNQKSGQSCSRSPHMPECFCVFVRGSLAPPRHFITLSKTSFEFSQLVSSTLHATTLAHSQAVIVS